MSRHTRALALLLILSTCLSSAMAQPVEFGPDDFRITSAGPAGDLSVGAAYPKIAYNSTDNQYFVVFRATDALGPVAAGEEELWGQRVSPQGQLIGDRTLLTGVGGVGMPGARVFNFQVLYIPSRNGYFVSYNADDPNFPFGALNVYGVVVSNTGEAQGAAVALTTGAGAFRPHLAHNTVDDEILLSWSRADDPSPGAIFVQRISAADGSPLAVEQRVNSSDLFASDPAVGYDPINNQYLVYWRGSESQAPMIQILNADGEPQLPQDRELASAGYFSSRANVAFDPDNQQFFVAWTNSDPAFSSMLAGSYEVFGRRVAANGELLGPGKFRISTSSDIDLAQGFGTNIDCGAQNPCMRTERVGLAYSSFDQAFIASWSSTLLQSDSTGSITNQNDNLVRLIPAGQDVDSTLPQVQIGNAGGDELGFFGIHAVVAAGDDGRYLVSWWGDDNRNGAVQGEIEIWGQALLSEQLILLFSDSFE